MATRRQFLAGTAAGIAGAGLLNTGHASAESLVVEEMPSLIDAGPSRGLGVHGKILTLGNLGYFHPAFRSRDVLSVLDLSNGSWSVVPSATELGHLGAALPDGGAMLMPRFDGKIDVKDRELNTRKVLTHPRMAFSGHCFSRGKMAWLAAEPLSLSAKEAPREGKEAGGFLVELNLETLEFGRELASGGIHPHDMCERADGRLVISHYGATWAAQQGSADTEAVMYALSEPCLTIMDVDAGKVEKKIVLPMDGASTHLAIGGDGRAYVMPLQYELFGGTDDLANATPDGVTLRQDEWKARRLGRPLPVRAVDLDTGKWQDIDLGPVLQRRGQSIAANAETGRVFGAFPYSDTLWCFDPKNGTAFANRGFDFGVHAIRGVCDIPGTPLIAISGEWEGVVVLDARSMKVAGRYAMPTHWAVHISAQMT